jgi:hypothetical protein
VTLHERLRARFLPCAFAENEGAGGLIVRARPAPLSASTISPPTPRPSREASRKQPADGGRIHVVRAGNISLRLAGSQASECLLPLMGIQLRRSTETNPTGLRAISALSGSGTDELALELG